MSDGLHDKEYLPANEPENSNSAEKEVEATKARLAELESLMVRKDEELRATSARIAGLEEALSGRDTEIASLKLAKADVEATFAGAVLSYRSLVLRANQGIVEELVGGDTVQAIDDSVTRAKALVGKVREGLAREISAIRVPAGAPERTSPDISGLSPREKIQNGIGGKR
ncbi:MAG: hypothetical protein HYX85_00375 [Chloroflexi bacterium]|nr:hypothetical protein [Chloroflexota bacterium]